MGCPLFVILKIYVTKVNTCVRHSIHVSAIYEGIQAT